MPKMEVEQHEILVRCGKLDDGRFLAKSRLSFEVGMEGATEKEAVENLMDGIGKLFKFLGFGMHPESMVKLTGESFDFKDPKRKVDA